MIVASGSEDNKSGQYGEDVNKREQTQAGFLLLYGLPGAVRQFTANSSVTVIKEWKGEQKSDE